jgi:hypothetical protein
MRIKITEAIETLNLHNPFMSNNTVLSESIDMAVIGLEKIQEIHKIIITEDFDDEKRVELINKIITTGWWKENKE